MNYGVAVWGFGGFTEPQILLNRIIRYNMGVHKFAPLSALYIEMDCPSMRSSRWLEMVRYRNCIVAMPDDRLPKLVFKWDRSLQTDAWARSIDFVLQNVNMMETVEYIPHIRDISYENLNDSICDLAHTDTDKVRKRLLQNCRDRWWLAAAEMPKLRTYVELHDEQDHRGLVYTPH